MAFGFGSDVYLFHIVVFGYQFSIAKFHVMHCVSTVLMINFTGNTHVSQGLVTMLQHIFITTYITVSHMYLVKS